MRAWTLAAGVALSVLLGAVATGQQAAGGEPLKWFKGNTHTHSLNSDGDSTPDEVVQWYREQRYHFLFFTDHNTVTPVDGLNAVFGAPDRFLVIRGEEVTDSADKKPVHLNMLGGEGVVAPQGGATPAESLRRNVAAIKAARGVVSVNHPNFGWALSASDLLEARGAELLEIFNAHYQVNNEGGGDQPGAEALWDGMLSAGITVFGVASDDVHEFKRPWVRTSARPGFGWIVVRAPRLTADAILSAIARGDFYASTGVELTDIQATPQRLTVTIKEQTYARYRVQFVGKGGRMLTEVSASPYQYDIVGSEGYVRARVRDSNGQMAWTQPVFVPAK
jgi:hypothetical protein